MLPLMHREFAFELQDGTFMRYYSFKDIAGLKTTVKKHVPTGVWCLAAVPVNKSRVDNSVV